MQVDGVYYNVSRTCRAGHVGTPAVLPPPVTQGILLKFLRAEGQVSTHR
jgi:hypothetical protein